MTNARADYIHKLSTIVVKNHDVIGIEDIQVSNMLKNVLEYKANESGK